MSVMPDGKSIANADELATTIDANMFLRQTLNKSIDKNRMQSDYTEVNAALDENTRLVRVRYSYTEQVTEKAFNGFATSTDLDYLKPGTMNFIEASVIESLAKLDNQQEQIAEVVMPYYIDETSQLVRGYMIDGEVV